MDRRGFLSAAPLAALSRVDVDRTLSADEERFVGMYRLVSSPGTGANPIGRIYYDKLGRMGAFLHPAERKRLPATPTVEDYREAERGLVAYFGTYTVDESTRRVIHHIEGAANPAQVGTDLVRWYEFQGDRLNLKTREDSTTPLVWERLPDA